MANQLVLIFKTDDLKKLIDTNPDKIVVRSTIEEDVLKSGEKVGVVRVYADAIRSGEADPLMTVPGCPDPPCDPN